MNHHEYRLEYQLTGSEEWVPYDYHHGHDGWTNKEEVRRRMKNWKKNLVIAERVRIRIRSVSEAETWMEEERDA